MAEKVVVESKSAAEQLAELQLKKLLKEEAETQVAEDQRRKFQLLNALEAKKKEEERLATQALCSHRKPDQRTAVAGYRSHDHVEHFVCQNCFKEWHGPEMPSALRPMREQIGGPI